MSIRQVVDEFYLPFLKSNYMRSINTNDNFERVPHILYDLSLSFPERITKAQVFPSTRLTAKFLGCDDKKISLVRKKGKKIKGVDGKEYAIRIFSVKNI